MENMENNITIIVWVDRKSLTEFIGLFAKGENLKMEDIKAIHWSIAMISTYTQVSVPILDWCKLEGYIDKLDPEYLKNKI